MTGPLTAARTAADLRATPNPLAAHYRRFAVADRLLLTGHSHQAWPDVALLGQLEAFEDAARDVDAKWAAAFERADRVRAGFRSWLDDPGGEIALGANTHELVLRFLSGLDLAARPVLVTTDGEFHTLRRQLTRLAEAGLRVVRVPAAPAATLAARLAAELSTLDGQVAAVLVSAVLFETAQVVPGLGALAAACQRAGTELLVDAYHALGPVPFPIHQLGLSDSWVVGGGYKYLQLGEGNCFLRLPGHADRFRPALTGWYAEFADLAEPPHPGQVGYGRGADRFAGATYDPTSHYRGARVVEFFAEHGLTPDLLHASYRHQVEVLARAFDDLDLPPDRITRDPELPGGGFLALRSPHAGEYQRALAERGVRTDSRAEHLRFGPAPYLSDDQLTAAIGALAEVVAR